MNEEQAMGEPEVEFEIETYRELALAPAEAQAEVPGLLRDPATGELFVMAARS